MSVQAVEIPSSILTDVEIASLREQTDLAPDIAHFNHAGDSPSPRPVVDAVIQHIRRETQIGGYEAADEARGRHDGVYCTIAKAIGAARDEIAIVENATRAWDMVFYSIPFTSGDRILTTANEYGSNAIAYLQMAKRGVSVEVIPQTPDGRADPTALQHMLDERVRFVGVSHMPTNSGLVQPAAEIGRALRESGCDAVYLLDACQSAGQMPLDVDDIGCHAMSATSRKYLRGPRGVGFLYVCSELANTLEPPFLDIHAAEWVAKDRYEIAPGARRFENWESNIAGALGLGVAVDYAAAIGFDRIWATIQQRAANLRQRLDSISGLTVHDLGAVRGGIVTFSIAGFAAEEVKAAMSVQRMNVSVSGASSTRYDMDSRGLDEIVRASVHYLTTEDECDRLTHAIRGLRSV